MNAAPKNVIVEFNNNNHSAESTASTARSAPANKSKEIYDVIGVRTDDRIEQIPSGRDSINTASLRDGPVNKYYYAVTNDEPPRLFIIYVKEKTDTTISYQIVYIRTPQGVWDRLIGGHLITVSHRKLPRTTELFPASGAERVGLTLYDIPDYNFVIRNNRGELVTIKPSQVKPPTFGYRGGKRKSRRVRRTRRARRAKRSQRSRRLKRK
jgi:hypothetical protein